MPPTTPHESSQPATWRGESVQSFAEALGLDETSVYPIPGNPPAAPSPRKRRRRLIGIVAALALVGIAVGSIVGVVRHRALADEYEQAWERYSALASEQEEALEEANALAEECRLAVEDSSECDRLDSAIMDAERGFPHLAKDSPSRERITELEDATAIGESTLERLRSALGEVEADMQDQVAGALAAALSEAREARESFQGALDSLASALVSVENSNVLGYQENVNAGEDDSSAAARLRSAVDDGAEARSGGESTLARLDSRISNAESMLAEGEAVRLGESVSVAEAADIVRVLRQATEEALHEREEVLYAADLIEVRASAAEEARRLAEQEEAARRAAGEAAGTGTIGNTGTGQGTDATGGGADTTGTGGATGTEGSADDSSGMGGAESESGSTTP